MLLRRYFYAENAKNAGVLLFVLCLNEEQQKHCVVRDLNINTYKDKDCSTKYQACLTNTALHVIMIYTIAFRRNIRYSRNKEQLL